MNLGVLRYHYITPQQNFTQENLKRYSDKTQKKMWWPKVYKSEIRNALVV
jgi:hypothetical protein